MLNLSQKAGSVDSASALQFIGPRFESKHDKGQGESWRFADKSRMQTTHLANLIIDAHTQTFCTDYFEWEWHIANSGN